MTSVAPRTFGQSRPVGRSALVGIRVLRLSAWARLFVCVLCLSLFVSQPRQAFAQSGATEEVDPFAGIEEMVVVGTGAASLFQNEEVSSIAFDASYLEALGANDLSDISQFTPNLEIRTPFAASSPTLFIRGVGLRDFNANSSSAVAVYNDEIYMNSPAGQLAQLFDVQNIDVLRGPQATIHARNASAGTIRVMARKPSFSPGGNVSVTYGRFDQVDIEGAVENVLVEDRLAVRTAAKYSRRDGTTHNRCRDIRFSTEPPPPDNNFRNFDYRVHQACYNSDNTGNPPFIVPPDPWVPGVPAPVKEWVNDVHNWGARTILRFQHPTADMDWQLNFHGGQNRGDARQFQMLAALQGPNELEPRLDVVFRRSGYADPDNQEGRIDASLPTGLDSPFLGDPYAGDYNNVEKELIDLFGTSLVGEMEFGDVQLTTITGYEWSKRDSEINLDGSPLKNLEPVLTNRAYQVTQEVRLDWSATDTLTWQLGNMFLYESLKTRNTFDLGFFNGTRNQNYTFFTRYNASWLNMAWDPTEAFKLEGGFRLNYEDKELNLQSTQSRAIGIPPVDGVANSATSETGIAGDVKFTYRPLEDVNFYLRYARGWKGPHINAGVINPNQTTTSGESLASPVEPEKVDALEFGMKARFWADRIKANWALFYYDYQDIQIFQLKNTNGGVPVQELVNANDADVFGFEAEFDIKPFEAWGPELLDQFWIHTTFAWLDSKYTDFVNKQVTVRESGGAFVRDILIEDFTGNTLINSPEFSFIGFVAWPVGGHWGSLTPRLDWSFKDKVYFSQANIDLASQDALWLFNLRLTYQSPNEKFEVSGWVENLTDQAYTVDVFNLARLLDTIVYAIGDPRTYGITFKARF